jgi:hypothetical protein
MATKTAIKATCADCFFGALHRTYSASRYCDLGDLPAALQEQIWQAGNVETECSSYTVGTTAAFVRGSVEIDGERFDFEISLGDLESGDERNDDGDLIDGNGDTIDDADLYFQTMADELFACTDSPDCLSVYFTPV